MTQVHRQLAMREQVGGQPVTRLVGRIHVGGQLRVLCVCVCEGTDGAGRGGGGDREGVRVSNKCICGGGTLV